MKRDDLRAALAISNVTAAIRMVRERESNQIDDGPQSAFTLLCGGKHIESLDRHPYHGISTSRVGHSTACGIGQFLGTTWAEFADRYGFEDFGPACQMECMVALFHRRGALDDIIAGRIELAIIKCRLEWTSLPGASESKSSWTMAKAVAVFEKYGGVAVYPDRSDAPAPIEERTIFGATSQGESMDPISLGLGLVASLVQAFTPLARQKIEGALEKHAGKEGAAQVADNLLKIAQDVTGATDPVVAVAAVKADPVIAQKVEDSAVDLLDRMAPMIDKLAALEKAGWDASEESMDRAAERARHEAWDMTRTLVWGALGTCAVLILFLCFIAGYQVVVSEDHEVSSAVWGSIVGAINFVAGVVTMIVMYRFGTNRQSQVKDATIAAAMKGRG